MTIAATITSQQYLRTGTTTQWGFNNKIFSAADLIVNDLDTSVPPIVTPLVLGVDYTVQNVDVDAGCMITTTVPGIGGHTLDVRTNIAELQTTSIKNQGSFLPELHEEAFDKLTREIQDLRRLTYAFGIHGPDVEPMPWPALPNAATRRNTALMFDAVTGLPTIGIPTTQTITQGTIGLLLYPQIAAEISAGVTPTLYFYPPGDLRRYGWVGDGVTNNYAAWTSALAVCKQSGLTLIHPYGNGVIDTASGTLTCSYVTIQGTGVTNGSATPAAAGGVISIKSVTNSPFTVGPGVTFNGLGFFYPAQVDSFTPIVFPPTIVTSLAIGGAINFTAVNDCTVFNAYRFFVDTDTTGALGHCFFENNTIYGILTCFEIAHNSEIITFTGNEFTFGHYLAATETGLRKYTRANGTVLQMPRTDGITFNGNALYGYLNGIWFNTTAGLLCQLTSITANYFDTTLFSILATGAGNVSGLTITANSFISYNPQLTTAVGNAIKITTTGTTTEQIAVSANNFSLCSGDEVNTSGTAIRNLTLTGNTFTAWALNSTAVRYGALNINGASTSYSATGNQFISQVATWASGIIGSCSTALISANVFGSCFNAINATYGTVLSSANLSFSTQDTFANNYNASGAITDIGCSWDKNAMKSPITVPIASFGNYANDAAAAAGGVFVGGFYRNSSVIQVRVT